MRGIDKAAFETLHRSNKKIDEISTETGINKASLYRYGMPLAQNGLDIPIRKLSPIMQAAHNYRILHVLAAENGFLVVREPKAPGCKADENILISRLQQSAAEAVGKTIQFFEKPSVTYMEAAEDALNASAGVAMGLKKLIQRRGQLEMRF